MYVLLFSLALTILIFAFLWLCHLPKSDLGLLDIYWGPGFWVISISHLLLVNDISATMMVLFVLTTIWSTRLGTYLWLRHRHTDGEDRRYARMRANGGPSFWWTSLFKICLLQAVIMWLIATPQHAAFLIPSDERADTILLLFGIAIFTVGISLETIADWQLFHFKKKRKTRGKR